MDNLAQKTVLDNPDYIEPFVGRAEIFDFEAEVRKIEDKKTRRRAETLAEESAERAFLENKKAHDIFNKECDELREVLLREVYEIEEYEKEIHGPVAEKFARDRKALQERLKTSSPAAIQSFIMKDKELCEKFLQDMDRADKKMTEKIESIRSKYAQGMKAAFQKKKAAALKAWGDHNARLIRIIKKADADQMWTKPSPNREY